MRSRIEGLLSSSHHVALVAETASGLAGWVTGEVRLSLGSEPRAEITGLVVDSDSRRSGIGSLLVAEIERWARDKGVQELFLRTNITRVESHPFYEHLGFVRAKTQHVYRKATP